MQNYNVVVSHFCFNVTARPYHWVNVQNKYNDNCLSAVKFCKYFLSILKSDIQNITKIPNNKFIKYTLK